MVNVVIVIGTTMLMIMVTMVSSGRAHVPLANVFCVAWQSDPEP